MSEPQRWAQLSYASFDSGSSGGGWQVKETRGEPTVLESQAVVARVVTHFDSHLPLPQFPSPEDIAALPRKLTYLHTAGSGVYWHAVPAGSDGTGRPGNVFSQGVIDRAPTGAAATGRPIELWRSPDFLSPFGAGQVLAAGLPGAAEPQRGSAVTRETVLDFLFGGTTWRVGLLCVLLDAISAARQGGRRLIFVAESVDSAALWVGALSYLTSPQLCAEISFSLYERHSGLAAAWERGILFIAVPQADAQKVAGSDEWVVINERETVTLGALGGENHVTAAGAHIVATAWSELAQVVLVERNLAGVTLERLDELSLLGSNGSADYAWPLAFATMLDDSDLEDALPFARPLIMHSLPLTEGWNPTLLAVLQRIAESESGETTATAWAAVKRIDAVRSPGGHDLLLNIYVSRALGDRDWLTQQGGAPVSSPVRSEPAHSVRELANDLLRAATNVSAAHGDRDSDRFTQSEAAYHLRLVDFLLATGILDDRVLITLPSADAAIDVLAGLTSQQLLSARGSDLLLELLGPETVSVPLREGILRAALSSRLDWAAESAGQNGQPGQVPPKVLDWLSQTPEPSLRKRRDDSSPPMVSNLDLLIDFRWLERQPRTRYLACVVLLSLLARHGSWAAVPGNFRTAIAAAQWEIGDLIVVQERYAGQWPPAVAIDFLAGAWWGAQVDEFTREVAQSIGDFAASQLARFRLSIRTAGSGRSLSTPAPDFALVLQALNSARGGIVWQEIAERFFAEAIGLAADGADVAGIWALNEMLEGASRALEANISVVADRVARLLRQRPDRATAGGSTNASASRDHPLDRLLMLALVTTTGFPVPLADGFARSVASFEVLDNDMRVRLLDEVVKHLIATLSPAQVDELVQRVSEQVNDRTPLFWHATTPQVSRDEIEKFTRTWWKRFGLSPARATTAKREVRKMFRNHDRKES